MTTTMQSIQIPMLNSEKEFVEIFPDELPITGGDNGMDYNDLIDVLRSEFAPLKVWRSCAVEYHRQGFPYEFNAVLNEIVDSLADPGVEEIYRNRPDFAENAADIYNALAAEALSELSKPSRDRSTTKDDPAARVVENLSKAEQQTRVNEYSWLIKGFYELRQGDIKRAEDHFKSVSQVAARKKKFSFAGHVGLGIVAFSQQKYAIALDHFIKAVQATPSCGPSVRVAIATCCFKLEQFDRALAAVERALSLDPANANALLLLALLEQVKARKSVGVSADHAKRLESRQNAYEYCMLVCAVDPSSCTALVHMANHCSHTWKPLSQDGENSVQLLDDRTSLIVESGFVKDLAVGDHIRFNSQKETFTVSQIGHTDDSEVVISLSSPVPESIAPVGEASANIFAEAKEFGRVFLLAFEAINSTTDKEILAEAYYVMGKAHHMQGQTDKALTCYRKSLAESEFILSAFGAAQIQLSKRELASSFDLFERVFQRYPDDKDVKAYYYLVKAMHKKQMTSMDQLKDVATGFQFEADLWILQGQLRFDNPNEHPNALKCLTNGLECLEQAKQSPDSILLSNIAVLHGTMGRLQNAVTFGKRALTVAERELVTEGGDSGQLPLNPPFKSPDLDGVFYSWSKPKFRVKAVSDTEFELIEFVESSASTTLSDYIAPGCEIVIGDIIHKVITVADDLVVASSAVTIRRSTDDAQNVFDVCIKSLWHNFSDTLVTLCFNYARMLEDSGATNAAIEIYVELLKQHPSYMECYLRLSRISRDLGRFDNASMWLSRALAVDSGNPDVNICLGDLYARGLLWEDAKKCYEKICGQQHHDSRAMLSLGNFYFATLSMRDAKYETHLKDSYKFFHHVLHEDRKNVYAAIGLGMICAEKGELEVAREIFSKAREANMSLADDICIDLGHVHFAQSRFLDAEHQYLATLKASHKDRNARSERLSGLCEYAAMAQYSNKRSEEAIKSLLRAAHYDPLTLRHWYNSAVARGDVATQIMQKSKRSAADIEVASEELTIAQKFFLFLGNTSIVQPQGAQFQKEYAMRHARICEANKSAYSEQLQATLEEEQRQLQERKRQDEEHNQWRLNKEEEKAKKLKALEDEKLEKQLIAVQKSKKLDELKEKWVAIPAAEPSAKKTKGKGLATAGKSKGDDSESDLDDDIANTKMVEDGSDSDLVISSKGVVAPSSTSAPNSSITAREVEDIFGSDDDADKSPVHGKKRSGEDSPNVDDGSSIAESPNAKAGPRKRLKKSSASDSDNDSDIDFGDSSGAPTRSAARVLEDNEDDF